MEQNIKGFRESLMLECQTKDMFFPFVARQTNKFINMKWFLCFPMIITIAITIHEYRDPENPLNSILTQSILSIFDISATS